MLCAHSRGAREAISRHRAAVRSRSLISLATLSSANMHIHTRVKNATRFSFLFFFFFIRSKSVSVLVPGCGTLLVHRAARLEHINVTSIVVLDSDVYLHCASHAHSSRCTTSFTRAQVSGVSRGRLCGAVLSRSATSLAIICCSARSTC